MGLIGVLKTLPSLLLFGLVFKLLVSVVSKGVIYFLIWRFKSQLTIRSWLQSANGSQQMLGLRVEHGLTKTQEVATGPNTKSYDSATPETLHWLMLVLGLGWWWMPRVIQMQAPFFTHKEPSQPETVMVSRTNNARRSRTNHSSNTDITW